MQKCWHKGGTNVFTVTGTNMSVEAGPRELRLGLVEDVKAYPHNGSVSIKHLLY